MTPERIFEAIYEDGPLSDMERINLIDFLEWIIVREITGAPPLHRVLH